MTGDNDVAAAPVRVLVVDDDAMVRTGLRLILGGTPRIHLVGEAADGRQGVAAARELHADVVLLDIRMPVMDGLAATQELQRLPRPPRVLILTTFDADDYVLRALRLGASGFLLKDTPPARMIEAIGRVAAGEPYLSPSVAGSVISAATGGGVAVPDDRLARQIGLLTEREQEVAVALAAGRSNAQIADQLHMSVATVKANITRVFQKLEVDNRVAAAMKVRDAGLAG